MRMLIPTMLAAWWACGCGAPLQRGVISTEEQSTFRAEAIRLLGSAGVAEDPSLRMNAIEAFSEAAPRESLPVIDINLESEYAGVSFAALMAIGMNRQKEFLERVRTRAEHPDANVRIAALFALHRLGDQRRTGELATYLLDSREARVRANAALVLGRLGDSSAVVLLNRALRHEKKDAPKLQIQEALAILGDRHATELLTFAGYSAYPDQATFALSALAAARTPEADDLFHDRLRSRDFPEICLTAARGLGQLGDKSGMDLAVILLGYNAPKSGRVNDPPEQQIRRVRGLAALALEAIGDREALAPLWEAFRLPGQATYVRVAIARAAIRIIDRYPAASLPQETSRLRP